MDKVFQYGYGHLLPVNYLFNKKVNKSKVILRKSTSIINSDKPFDFMEAELKKGSHELLRDQSGLLVAGKAVGSGLSFFYALPFDQTVMAAHANQMQEFLSFFINMSRRVLMPSDHMGSDLERYMTGMRNAGSR